MDKAIKLMISSNGQDYKNNEFVKSKTWSRLQKLVKSINVDKVIKLTVSSNGRDYKNDEFVKSKTWTRLQSRRVHQVDKAIKLTKLQRMESSS